MFSENFYSVEVSKQYQRKKLIHNFILSLLLSYLLSGATRRAEAVDWVAGNISSNHVPEKFQKELQHHYQQGHIVIYGDQVFYKNISEPQAIPEWLINTLPQSLPTQPMLSIYTLDDNKLKLLEAHNSQSPVTASSWWSLKKGDVDLINKKHRRKIIKNNLANQQIVVDGAFYYLPPEAAIDHHQITQAFNQAAQQQPLSELNAFIWIAEIPEQGESLSFSSEFANNPIISEQTYTSPAEQPSEWPDLELAIPENTPSQSLFPPEDSATPTASHSSLTSTAYQRPGNVLRFGNIQTSIRRLTAKKFISKCNNEGGVVIYNGYINLPSHLQNSPALAQYLSQQYSYALQAYPQFNTPNHAWLIMNNEEGQSVWTPFVIDEQVGQVMPLSPGNAAPDPTAAACLPAPQSYQNDFGQMYQIPLQHLPYVSCEQPQDSFFISHFHGNQLISMHPVQMPMPPVQPPLPMPPQLQIPQYANTQPHPAEIPQTFGNYPDNSINNQPPPVSQENSVAVDLPKLIPNESPQEVSPNLIDTAPTENSSEEHDFSNSQAEASTREQLQQERLKNEGLKKKKLKKKKLKKKRLKKEPKTEMLQLLSSPAGAYSGRREPEDQKAHETIKIVNQLSLNVNILQIITPPKEDATFKPTSPPRRANQQSKNKETSKPQQSAILNPYNILAGVSFVFIPLTAISIYWLWGSVTNTASAPKLKTVPAAPTGTSNTQLQQRNNKKIKAEKKQEWLNSLDNNIMKQLAEELLETDAVIPLPIFFQRHIPVQTKDFREHVLHYSPNQFKKEFKVLHLMPLHRWTYFSKLSGREKLQLLETVGKWVIQVHQNSELTPELAFLWLMLLCGKPDLDISHLSCHKKASTLLINGWHLESYAEPLFASYLKLGDKNAIGKSIETAFWQVTSKNKIANEPKIFPVFYTGQNAEPVFPESRHQGDRRFLYSDIGINSLEGLMFQTASMQWQPVTSAHYNEIAGKRGTEDAIGFSFNHRSIALRQPMGEHHYVYRLIYKGYPVARATPILQHHDLSGNTVDCATLTTISAQNLCFEMLDEYAHLDLFIKLVSSDPHINIPVYRALGWNHETEKTVFISSDAIKKNVQMQLKANNKVITSFASTKLIRLDELPAKKIKYLFKLLFHAVYTNNSHPDMETLVNTLKVCGHIPAQNDQLTCYTELLTIKPFLPGTVFAKAASYIQKKFPEFYHGLSGMHVRYIPMLWFGKDTQKKFTVRLYPLGQLVTEGIPKQFLTYYGETRFLELPITAADMQNKFFVIGEAGKLFQIELSPYVEVAHTSTYFMTTSDGRPPEKVFSFFEGQLLPEIPEVPEIEYKPSDN